MMRRLGQNSDVLAQHASILNQLDPATRRIWEQWILTENPSPRDVGMRYTFEISRAQDIEAGQAMAEQQRAVSTAQSQSESFARNIAYKPNTVVNTILIVSAVGIVGYGIGKLPKKKARK